MEEDAVAKSYVKQDTVRITENPGVAADDSPRIDSPIERSIVRELDFKYASASSSMVSMLNKY